MATDIRVAWWNLENLFDSSTAARDPELERVLKNELKGWTATVRDKKLGQLAKIIEQMFGGEGPDVLGVCEVENENVVKMLVDRVDLPGRDYKVVGHKSPDARGIDVSFLFDRNVVTASNPGHQVVIKRTATRDIFWITLTVKATENSFVAIANHWPARTAGQYKSEPFRLLTGETLSYVLSNLLDPKADGDANSPILVMGDFNDEPFHRSMREYLLGSRDRGRVMRSRSPRLLNLMWPPMAQKDPGTYRFGSDWNMLDQFLVSKGMLRKNSSIRVLRDSVGIFRPEEMVGSGGAPRRFGRPSKKSSFDESGFSDHYPITVRLEAR